MCIVDPGHSKLAEREGFLGHMFSSHPPMRVRLARLRAMAYQAEKQGGVLPDPADIVG
jgi:Zn-dependent protease with chaperone function